MFQAFVDPAITTRVWFTKSTGKLTPGGEPLVPGSANLIQTLLDEDLVDELQLITYPVVLGKGRRLFESGLKPSAWELVECSPMPKGTVACVYRFAGRRTCPSIGSL